jgi:hypothetical protein
VWAKRDGRLALTVLEYDFANYLLEHHTLPSFLYAVSALTHNPSLELIVYLCIDHMYFGKQRIKISKVVDFLEVEDHFLLLLRQLTRKRLDRKRLLVSPESWQL